MKRWQTRTRHTLLSLKCCDMVHEVKNRRVTSFESDIFSSQGPLQGQPSMGLDSVPQRQQCVLNSGAVARVRQSDTARTGQQSRFEKSHYHWRLQSGRRNHRSTEHRNGARVQTCEHHGESSQKLHTEAPPNSVASIRFCRIAFACNRRVTFSAQQQSTTFCQGASNSHFPNQHLVFRSAPAGL